MGDAEGSSALVHEADLILGARGGGGAPGVLRSPPLPDALRALRALIAAFFPVVFPSRVCVESKNILHQIAPPVGENRFLSGRVQPSLLPRSSTTSLSSSPILAAESSSLPDRG